MMSNKINSGVYIDSDGTELTVEQNEGIGCADYTNAAGEFHRLDGPAIIHSNGSVSWWQNDRRHRLDGPAIEYANGDKEWWQKGKLHRLDGPAIERANGDKFWRVNDKQVEPLFLVSYWLERGRCCWYDETTNELRFGDV